MKKTYFTVGPSKLYETFEKHLKAAVREEIGSLNHRSKGFQELYLQTATNMRRLLGIPKTHEIFFVGSANEAMERIIENTVEKESFHVITGAFSQKFYDFAKKLGKSPKRIEAKEAEGFTSSSLNIAKTAELICFTQNETSTGIWVSEKTIAEAKRQNPASLIAVDVVSSMPYVSLDFSKTDCVFFSVQKLFGLPAGLGVLIVSPQALEKAYYLEKKEMVIGTYHSFPNLKLWSDKYQTAETPPVLLIYLLNKVIKDMQKTGLPKLRKQLDKKAKRLYDFFDSHPTFKPFVKKPEFRSPTIIIPILDKKTKQIKSLLEKKGLIVGGGYGKYKESQIRIANFPAHTMKDIESIIKVLKKA